MKGKVIVLVAIMASCFLIAGCTEEVANSPYTVSHKIEKVNTGLFSSERLVVTVDGPADDLLLILVKGEYEQEKFLSKEQMAASSVNKVDFSARKPGDYELIIRKSDPSKKAGSMVHKEMLTVEAGKIEIQKVSVIKNWPLSDTRAVIHHYEGGFPVEIDYLMVYTQEGEKKFSNSVKLEPGETKNVIVSYDEQKGGDIRVYAYSEGEVIASFEGKIT